MVSESRENLVGSNADLSSSSDPIEDPYSTLDSPDDYVLTQVEKTFLLSAERGDCASVRR